MRIFYRHGQKAVSHKIRLGFATPLLLSCSLTAVIYSPVNASPLPAMTFRGICNASAAIDVGLGLLVVADDEDGVIENGSIVPLPFRSYSLNQPGPPVQIPTLAGQALEPVVGVGVKGELDLEGSARIGDTVYWIGSHSAGKGGKVALNRRRLFGTKLRLEGNQLTVAPVGRPYTTLLGDLSRDPRSQPFRLDEASRIDSKASGGLSIEGLAATPSGGLMVGFRNPVPGGKALVATLENPAEVIMGQPAKFAAPIELNLNGLGIRSMEAVNGQVLIVAGPSGQPVLNAAGTGSVPPHALYRWSGLVGTAPQLVPNIDLSRIFPEALFVSDSRLVLLSDDGKMLVNGTECQKLNSSDRRFRAISLPFPTP